MIVSPSLFEAPSDAVFPAAADWLTAALMGQVAVVLCVLAVAFIGFMMMTGRLPIREGLRVVIGCFVLLGAPVIAAGLFNTASDMSNRPPVSAILETQPTIPEVPDQHYDRYAGASSRRD